MNNNYILLEKTTEDALGHPLSFTIGQTGSLFAVSSFLMFLILVAGGGAAIIRILYALGIRVGTFGEASEAKISESKKIISSVLFSLLFSFGLVLFMLAINPDVVTGDVNWAGIRVGGSSATSGVNNSSSNNSQGQQGASNLTAVTASCPNADTYKSGLVAGKNVCDGATCQAMAGCNLSAYASIIEQESAKQGVNPSLVKAIMCRESKGKADATHVNNPPTNIDCGLMQINKPGITCAPEDFNPATNIATGVSLIKQKFNSISQTYPGISKEMLVFAAYNCCGTEGSPNQESRDCTTSAGFPFTLPKWACPINPGPTATNMCFVRGYVCDITACIHQLDQ